MIRKVLAVFLLVALFVLPVAAQDKSYSADRFDVDVAIQTGGSLQVDEQVDFRFVGGPFSYVFRELPTDHTDGIQNIVAGANGVPWPVGTGPGQVEIEDGNPIRVTWHLSPTSNTVETFDLSYEALGVVRQDENGDILDWQALPESYEYTIASSLVTFTYPLSAELQGTPVLLDSKGDISVVGNQVRVTAGNVGPDEPLVARLTFVPGTVITAPPAWQAQEQAANDLAWVWAVLAGLVLVGGSAAILMAARPYRRKEIRADGIAYTPPSNLAPAIAGVISGSDTSIGWQHALATVFDFAGRGYLDIEEQSSGKWYEGKDFLITLTTQPDNLSAHEQALFSMLFTDKAGRPLTSVSGTEMGKLVTSGRWSEYKDALEGELILADLLSPKRKDGVKRFAIFGTLLLMLAIAMFVAALLLGSQFGYWTLLPVGALFILAMVAYIVAASISTRTPQGEQVAAFWAPFRRYLEQASKGKESIPNPELFERYLPYATAFGVAEQWAKQNEKAGWHQAPSYFRGMNLDDGASTGAFIAIIAASNSSGGAASAAAGSAAAAGAAGGGASGAG